MKKAILIMVLLIPFFAKVNAQSSSTRNNADSVKIPTYAYCNLASAPRAGQSCSVILLNDQWIIQSYSRAEKAFLNLLAEGIISVRETGDIAAKSFKNEKLEFRIGIKRKTGVIEVLFGNATLKTVKAQDVLSRCEPGDKIVVMLKDNQRYYLPHYEIEVKEGGC